MCYFDFNTIALVQLHKTKPMKNFFQSFSQQCAELAGTPWAFLVAISMIITWAIAGPALKFSDGWMLIINTSTTIITFLMVFVIQAAQNRDSKIARVERQSILRAIDQAPDTLIGLEKESDEKIGEIQAELHQVRSDADEA